VNLFLYVNDVDAAFKRAVDAGAKVDMPLADMFWGDRYGKLTDPFGHTWSMATHKEDVAPEEMKKRADAAMAKMSQQTKTAS
jgi:PhnB protein